MRTIIRNIIPIIILALGMSSVAYAQVPGLSRFQPKSIVPPFAIVATPSSPSPGESVTVEAQPSSFDGTMANFIWTIDGVSHPDISGIGRSTFTYTAGVMGSRSQISVRVLPIGANPANASLAVYVTDLVLTWTADTYIPKWYKGKALPIPNSTIHIAAIPTIIIDGDAIPADKLIYTWNVNGERKLRGAGQQALTLQEPEQSWNTPTVVLTVEDFTHRVRKEARTGVVASDPKAVIYQSLPLGGVEFRRGTSAFPAVAPSTLDLQVEPFFFNTTSRYDLSYQWSIGGIPAAPSAAKNPFLLTLDMSQQLPGTVALGVQVEHKNTDISTPSASNFLTIPIQKK